MECLTFLSELWFPAIALAILLTAAWQQARDKYAFQYLYFLRFPMLLGLVLLSLWILGFGEDSPLHNLFVLERGGQMFLVAFLATLAAWVVMYTGLLIWTRTPRRANIFFSPKPSSRGPFGENGLHRWIAFHSKDGRPVSLGAHLRVLLTRLILFGVLAAPAIIVCAWWSRDASGNARLWAAAWGGAGCAAVVIVVAVYARMGASLVLNGVRARFKLGSRQDKLARATTQPNWIQRKLKGAKKGFERKGQVSHVNAFSYFVLTMIVYWIAGVAGGSTEELAEDVPRVPALAHVLLLFILLSWLLPLASFLFDKLRFPAELILVLLFAIAYSVSNTDHFYETTFIDAGVGDAPDCSCGPWPNDGRPIVVVAASGGGIAASAWVATVLTGLESQFGREFADSIQLISATSGGAVGAMYYADAHTAHEPRLVGLDQDFIHDHVRVAAGRTSLSSLVRGLVHKDVWSPARQFSGKIDDRGSALEERWDESLLGGGGDGATIAAWRRDSSCDTDNTNTCRDRPGVAFNTTLVESGDAMVITTADCLSTRSNQTTAFLRFADLYPERDIKITTAARLSATFPWVTPAARPYGPVNHSDQSDQGEEDEDLARGPYHVVDGGYYDNFGVVTALRFIENVLATGDHPPVILVEVRASPRKRAQAKVDAGFYFETLGPVAAMYQVRTASQRARNDAQVESLINRTERDEFAGHVVFELGDEMPLSWHLASKEREDLWAFWRSEAISEPLGRLNELWSNAVRIPSPSPRPVAPQL